MELYEKIYLVVLGMIGGSILRVLINLVKEEVNLLKYRKRRKKREKQELVEDVNELLTKVRHHEDRIDYVLNKTTNAFAMIEKLESKIKEHENDSR